MRVCEFKNLIWLLSSVITLFSSVFCISGPGRNVHRRPVDHILVDTLLWNDKGLILRLACSRYSQLKQIVSQFSRCHNVLETWIRSRARKRHELHNYLMSTKWKWYPHTRRHSRWKLNQRDIFSHRRNAVGRVRLGTPAPLRLGPSRNAQSVWHNSRWDFQPSPCVNHSVTSVLLPPTFHTKNGP